jgi:hypothetical protein
MRKLWLALVLLCACGGSADFTGTWSGTVTQNIQCAVGGAQSETYTALIVITQAGDVLTITAGTCGDLTADVRGDTATIRAKSCPSSVVNGTTVSLEFTGGAITHNGDTITYVPKMQASSGPTGVCSLSVAGVLSKQ